MVLIRHYRPSSSQAFRTGNSNSQVIAPIEQDIGLQNGYCPSSNLRAWNSFAASNFGALSSV